MPRGIYKRPVPKCPQCGGTPHLTPFKIKIHDYKCIECDRLKNRDKLRRQRAIKHPALLARDRKNAINQRERYPEKIKARRLVSAAIKTGKLEKPDECSRCAASGRMEAHHHNGYENALDVQWFCVGCHKEAHRALAKETK